MIIGTEYVGIRCFEIDVHDRSWMLSRNFRSLWNVYKKVLMRGLQLSCWLVAFTSVRRAFCVKRLRMYNIGRLLFNIIIGFEAVKTLDLLALKSYSTAIKN